MTLAGGLPSVEKPVTCRGSSRLGAGWVMKDGKNSDLTYRIHPKFRGKLKIHRDFRDFPLTFKNMNEQSMRGIDRNLVKGLRMETASQVTCLQGIQQQTCDGKWLRTLHLLLEAISLVRFMLKHQMGEVPTL